MRVGSLSLILLAFTIGCGDEVLVSIPDPPPEPEERERGEEPPEQEETNPPPPPQQEEEDPEEAPPPPPPPPPPVTSGDECSVDSDCGVNAECEAGVCVGVGLLQITLTFFVDADYDLHVITPSGTEIYYGNPVADGGSLDVDQCVFDCGPGTHVENIFFNEDPMSGPYTAWAENYDGRAGGAFRIEVSGATTALLEGSLYDFPGERSDDLNFFVD